MSIAVRLTGLLLVLLAGALVAFKVHRYDIPLAPTEPLGPWSVELTVSVRGAGQRGSVTALLPTTEEGQQVFDEQPVSDRLDFEERSFAGNRIGVWTGWLEDVHEVAYRFRVQLRETPVSWPPPTAPGLGRDAIRQGTRPTPELPASAPEVQQLIEALGLPGPDDAPARVRELFAFVSHEVATQSTAGDDALLTLARREGSALGKERLLATLMRAVGMPARLVHGLALRDGQRPEPTSWVEVRAGDVWLPMSAAEGFFMRRPETHLVLGRGALAPVEATGVRAVGHRFQALRQRLRPDEIASLMAPDNPLLSALSLYRLPVGTQAALRVLLLLPLGALITAVFRNMVGIQTYGTFFPALIALALREQPLGSAIVLLAIVVGTALGIRTAVERLRLLLVPRLSIVLSVVVLVLAGVALANTGTGAAAGRIVSGAILPVVILSMLVERIYVVAEEEGLREAMMRLGGSLVVAGAILPVFKSPLAEHLMFSFPELVIGVMGLLVWIGGYTGYRLAELVRFRSLAREEEL